MSGDPGPSGAGQPKGRGFVDLHCHLLWGLDDGAKTLDDSLEMARVLVQLGFDRVAPSPHARPQYAPKALALERLAEVQAELSRHAIPLTLFPNAENDLLHAGLVAELTTASARLLGAGKYLLVEAPYVAPVPALPDIVFRVKLKGVTPLFAHPERCKEFERPGRAAEAVRAGARLQLDLGSLIGKYGRTARKLAQAFLGEGLYSVASTDLHSPQKAREWVGEAMAALETEVGRDGAAALLGANPARILEGEPLD